MSDFHDTIVIGRSVRACSLAPKAWWWKRRSPVWNKAICPPNTNLERSLFIIRTNCSDDLREHDDNLVARVRRHTGQVSSIAAPDDAQQATLAQSLYDALNANRGRSHPMLTLKRCHETAALESDKDTRRLERIIFDEQAR